MLVNIPKGKKVPLLDAFHVAMRAVADVQNAAMEAKRPGMACSLNEVFRQLSESKRTIAGDKEDE